jgi:5-methylcytosine rRNA methyltransferase NSUN4
VPKPGFMEYYKDIFHDRWEQLYTALLAEPRYHTLRQGLLGPYYLDKASYTAACRLPLSGKHSILDMCAAPGGKALVLAVRMEADARLTLNERSSTRRRRLNMVLETHLPREIRDRLRVTGHDAAKWGLYEQNAYDAVLVDVPCSSERHIAGSPAHMAKWGPARSKHLSIQAYSMLASAFMAVQPGGHILYSTCALLDKENDDVVEKLLSRRPGECEVVTADAEIGEKTVFGVRIMPDRCGGMGPMYYSLLQRNL